MFRTAFKSTILSRTRTRTISTIRTVESTASRSLALPLCFVNVKGLDSSDWSNWVEKFSKKGYSSLLVDIDPSPSSTTRELLSALEREFVSLLEQSSSTPFPPLLFASSYSTLLAETYVSSHPLSGLVLQNPISPSSSSSLKLPTLLLQQQHVENDDDDDDLVVKFDYEPFFPIAVIEEFERGKPPPKGKEENRLVREFGGDDDDEGFVKRITGKRDDRGWQDVMEWMDENGL